jgi:hypothetical protein
VHLHGMWAHFLIAWFGIEVLSSSDQSVSILTAVIRCICVSKPNVRSRARFSSQRVLLLFQLETLESAIVRVGQNDVGDRYEERGFIGVTGYACPFRF